jgi:acetyltransferase-like isoleucine patch superfamily enzyme
MHLKDHKATPKLRALEDAAMRTMDSPLMWWGFNFILGSFAILVRPLPEAVWVFTYFGVAHFWDPEAGAGIASLLLIAPFVYFIVSFIELLTTIAFKWILIGAYKAGDVVFLSSYHIKWMIMMMLRGGTRVLVEAIEGTVFNSLFYRANGAKVGNNCYLAGLAVEYDLLNVGDRAAIGWGCDATCHTVENMIIKLAPTTIHKDVSICNFSFTMPGSTLMPDSSLLENSQVLKGETVPSGEVWAGMPATRCNPRGPEPTAGKNYGACLKMGMTEV